MNASDQASRHGHDERMRVLGACHRLDVDDSPEGVADAVAAYGQPTVEAAIVFRERRAKDATIRDSKGPMKVLLQSMSLRTRMDAILRYPQTDHKTVSTNATGRKYRIHTIDGKWVDETQALESFCGSAQADGVVRRTQCALHQLDADASPYGIEMAIQIHGKPMIDQIMIMRLYQLRADARESGISMSQPEHISVTNDEFHRTASGNA